MADTVTTITVIDDDTNTVVHLTGISDATGEAAVKKVDIAAILANEYGVQAESLHVEQLRWAIQGYGYIQLLFDRTAGPYTIAVLCGSGYDDFRGLGRGTRNMQRLRGLLDPGHASADGKGSILLTSQGQVNHGSYDITIWLGKAQNKS